MSATVCMRTAALCCSTYFCLYSYNVAGFEGKRMAGKEFYLYIEGKRVEVTEEQTVTSLLLECAVELLTPVERELVEELYFPERTEREVVKLG